MNELKSVTTWASTEKTSLSGNKDTNTLATNETTTLRQPNNNTKSTQLLYKIYSTGAISLFSQHGDKGQSTGEVRFSQTVFGKHLFH